MNCIGTPGSALLPVAAAVAALLAALPAAAHGLPDGTRVRIGATGPGDKSRTAR
jgi:hypothetical protein